MRRLALAIAVALLATGCADAGDGTVEAVPERPQQTMVVVGAGESDGTRLDDELRELWSRRVYQRMPPHWALIGLAVSGATVAEANATQVPSALEVDPDLVLVWLVSADADAGTPLDAYRSGLIEVVESFPDAEVALLTSWATRDAEAEAPYSEAVRQVAADTDATLVDLDGLDVADAGVEGEVAQRVLDALRVRPR